ncbi:MAG: thioredoxin family protein [Actinomycetota bacterium]|jgi:glutaredoxin 3
MSDDPTTAVRRVEVFSAGCPVCDTTVAELTALIDGRHQLVVHDLHGDAEAADRARSYGVRTVPAVVVDGSLLACCRNTGPTADELAAAGLT